MGGSTQTKYKVFYARAGSTSWLQSDVLEARSYTASNLSTGKNYDIKIVAINSFGQSDYSSPLEVLCGWVPDAPEAPTTEIIGDEVIVRIMKPQENGSEITSYKVYIKPSGVTFFEQATCTNPDVLTTLKCVIELAALRTKPFNL